MNDINAFKISKLSIVVLFGLLLGSIYFYQERIIFSDAAWIVYSIINKQDLNIIENRLGAFITQIFPLAATYLGLSLSTVLILYSISFNLFYFSSALYLHRIGQYSLSITLGIYYTLSCSVAYYWTNNEIHQAVCWLALFIGTALYNEECNKSPAFKYSCFLILGFIALFTHPLVLFICIFLWGFLFLEQKEKAVKGSSFLIYTLIIAVILGLKLFLSQRGWYDGQKISNLTNANIASVIAAFKSVTAQEFLNNLLYKYWQLSIITLLSISLLIKRKNFLLLSWMISCAVLYFLSICITYPEKSVHFYIESEWMPISIILTFYFVRYLIPILNSKLIVIMMVFVFSLRLFQIFMSSVPFTNRLNSVKDIVKSCREQKTTKMIYTNRNDELDKQLMMSWGMPLETIILSNLDYQQISVTAILMTKDDFINRKINELDKYQMIEPFEIIPSNLMNKRYFRFDTLQLYQISELKLKTK